MKIGLSFLSISVIASVLILFSCRASTQPNSQAQQAPRGYLGFDLNIFPGKDALSAFGKTFSFSSYWLSPPTGEKTNTWLGQRELLRSQGFGFLLLYLGPLNRELKNEPAAVQKGILDARLLSQRAKAFPRKQSFFLISKKAAVFPQRITLICVLGLAGSQKQVIVLERTAPESPSKKNQASRSQPRTTSARILPRRISFISFSTMSVRLRLVAPIRRIRPPQRSAVFSTRRSGNTRSRRAAWSAPRTVRRAIIPTATAMLPATLRTLGLSTWTPLPLPSNAAGENK